MNTYSLMNWLALCATYKIPAIPATELGRLPVQDILALQDGDPVSPDTLAFLHALPGRLSPRSMVRWDCCAGEHLKAALSDGEPDWQPAFQRLVIDDFRLFRILVEDVGVDQSIAVLERPWITPRLWERYPIEVRVFASQGAITGVSSYYPQRPLQDTPEIQDLCQHALDLSARFLPAVSDFTADWMLTDTGILFLEGGPPHTLTRGAHPCCFVPGQTHGVALAPQPGSPCASPSALPDVLPSS